MGESKLGTVVRSVIRAVFKRRTEKKTGSVWNMRQVPHRARLSTRGEPADTWHTKKWTKARRKMRDEAFEARLKMARGEGSVKGRARRAAHLMSKFKTCVSCLHFTVPRDPMSYPMGAMCARPNRTVLELISHGTTQSIILTHADWERYGGGVHAFDEHGNSIERCGVEAKFHEPK